MRARTFVEAINYAHGELMAFGEVVDTGRWQGYSTAGHPDLVTKEVLNLQLDVLMPDDLKELQDEIQPNLPWADDHFEERVSRVPSNPGEAYKTWPWWRGQDDKTMSGGGIFTHTYQERFWPKYAHSWPPYVDPEGIVNNGIRYKYGDLDDVVKLLVKEPHTRQAYLPIFFPEDTGAVHGGRIPCTLGYHFMLRDNELHMWYHIRSCDMVRHFRDDLYLAARLLLWVIRECRREKFKVIADDEDNLWDLVIPGRLHFTAYSFHVHAGDEHHLLSPPWTE